MSEAQTKDVDTEPQADWADTLQRQSVVKAKSVLEPLQEDPEFPSDSKEITSLATKTRRRKGKNKNAPPQSETKKKKKKISERPHSKEQTDNESVSSKDVVLSSGKPLNSNKSSPPQIRTSLASERTLSSVGESSTDAPSSSISYSRVVEGTNFIKPPYVMKRSSFVSSALSRDTLASSAYNLIAYKMDEFESDFAKRKSRAMSDIRQDLGLDFGRRLGSDACESDSFSRGPTKRGPDRHRKPLNKEIQEFVLTAQELYNTPMPPHLQGRVRKSHYPIKHLDASFKRSPSKVRGGLVDDEPNIPVIRSVSPPPQRGPRGSGFVNQLSKTSNLVLPKQTTSIPKPVTIPPDALGGLEEEIDDALSDIKVKITRRESEESKFNFYECKAILEPISKRRKDLRERDQFRAQLADFRRLSKTAETSYLANLDMMAQARLPFKEDCRSVFRTQRIPTLRRSPAYIVYPVPLDQCISSSGSVPSNHIGSKISLPMDSVSTDRSTHRISSMVYDVIYQHQRIQHVSHVPNEEKEGYGSLRVDSLKIGSPRFYPWAPFNQELVREMRCRVLQAALNMDHAHLNRKALASLVLQAERKKEERGSSLVSKPKKLRPFTKCKKVATNSVVAPKKAN